MSEVRILLVDSDTQGSSGYQAQLEADGFTVYQAGTLQAAWFAVEEILPDLILLDVTLPDGSGLDFCQALRASHRMPVLFFTCQAEPEVDALLLGGDDYILKPCSYPVLHARIVAALRRRLPELSQVIACPPLRIDLLTGTVTLSGKSITLPQKQFQLLCLLASAPGQRISSQELKRKVWGEAGTSDNTLSQNISRLRTALELESLRAVLHAGSELCVPAGLGGVFLDKGGKNPYNIQIPLYV